MADSKVQYIVEVSKTGTGGQQAAAELNAAAAAARQTNAGFANLSGTAKGVRASLRALEGSATILGLQMFPQLTMTGMAAANTMRSLGAAAAAVGVSAGTAAAGIAGIGAVIASATAGWKAYKAAQNEALTAANLAGQQSDIRGRLLEIIEQQRERLAPGEADRLIGRLQNSPPEILEDRIASVRNRLRDVIGTESQIEAAQKLAALEHQIATQTLDDLEQQRIKAYDLFAERMKQIDALAAKSGRQTTPEEVNRARKLAEEELNLTEQKIAAERREAEAKAATQQEELRRVALAKQAAGEIALLEQNLTIASLQSSEDRVTIAEREYTARTDLFQRLVAEGALSEDELTQHMNQAYIERLRALKAAKAEEVKAAAKTAKELTELEQLGLRIGREFTDGLGSAFVQTFQKGGKAFQEFAATFLQKTAEMLAQFALFSFFKSLTKGTSFGAFFFGAAEGGVFPRMMATGGIQTVSQPTFFPRFNVVAGEAGAEMMAVLSRPRLMNLGGIEAAVGNAQGNRLALASADALAQRAGGNIVVEIRHSPETEARIVENSVQGAVVRVTRDMGRNTQLREATRKIT